MWPSLKSNIPVTQKLAVWEIIYTFTAMAAVHLFKPELENMIQLHVIDGQFGWLVRAQAVYTER